MAWSDGLPRTVLIIAALCLAGTVRGASSGVTICSCDLSPGNCDINCCCDPDCALSDPTSVFTSCLPGSTKAERWVCLYNWLIFRNNTPYTTTVVGSPPAQLFCVLSADASLNYFVTPQTVNSSNFVSVSEPYRGPSFSAASGAVPVFSGFYRAGDPVLTVSSTNTLSVLRQPAPVGAGNTCSDQNPAQFLMSGSTLCLRVFSNLTASCETDLTLNASYYYQDIFVLKVPSGVSSLGAGAISISSSVTDQPILQGQQCNNVVSQVTYIVVYNGTQGIVSVSVDFKLINVSTTSPSIQQNTTVIYKPVTSTASIPVQSRSGNPGYLVGYPVLSDAGHLLLPQSVVGGSCSYSPVQFGVNALSGCTISGTAQGSCSDFQTLAYRTLLGGNAPQSLAIYGNVTAAQSAYWTQIIYRNCSGQGNCSTGCPIPVSLDMQIMWARVGLISNPQAQLLRARFLYTCQSVKCQDTTVLQTQVSFTDLTRRGPDPRANPGITGRDPVDFFFPFQMNTAATRGGSLVLVFALYFWMEVEGF